MVGEGQSLYGEEWGQGPCMGTTPRGQKDMTENITFPQLHWRLVEMNKKGND